MPQGTEATRAPAVQEPTSAGSWDEPTRLPGITGWWLAGLATVGAFLAVHRELFRLPPHGDSWTALWMARELPWWAPLIDPSSAGYIYVFFFEPLYVPLHMPDLLLGPALGAAAFHAVPFLALVGTALILAVLVHDATASRGLALAVLALFLFNSASWYVLADTAYRHYPVATAFALLSVRPAWRWFVAHRPPRTVSKWLSALAYFAGLTAKESVAGLPFLIAILLWRGGMPPSRVVRHLIPHTVALVGFLAWRVAMIGGLGGYVSEPSIAPLNVLWGFLAASLALWGSAWLGLVLLVLGLILRPSQFAIWLAAGLAAMAPFALTFPLDPSGGGVGKLTLGIACFFLLLANAVAEKTRHPVARGSVLVASLALVVWQGRHHDSVAGLPFARLPQPAFTSAGVVIATPLTFLDVAWERQVRAVKPELATVFATPEDWDLYRILVGDSSRGAPALTSEPTVHPLAADRYSIEVSPRGLVRLCIDAGSGTAKVAGLSQNGATRTFVTVPLGRSCWVAPLSYSIKSAYLIVEGELDRNLQVYRWDSPLFRDPYPATRD